MKDMKRKFFIGGGIFYLIVDILAFLGGGSPSHLNGSIFGAMLILIGIFGMSENNEYTTLNKSSYLGMLGLIIYTGLIITYQFRFKPAFVNDLNFYFSIIIFMFLIIWTPFEYRKFRKYQKVAGPYEKALKLNPEDVAAWTNKGSVLAEFKAYSDAVKCFDKALELNPKNVKALYNEGNVLAKMKIYQTAAEYYDKALEINPNNTEIWNNKGNALTKLGKYQEAIDCYNKILELDPKYAKAWYNKGNAFQELGNHQKALECYNKTLELDSDFEFTKRAKKIILEN